MKQIITIYALKCPVSKDIKWIGATTYGKYRLDGHLYDKTHKEKYAWIQMLKSENLKPLFIPIRLTDNRRIAQIAELKYIRKYKETVYNKRGISLPY